MYRYRITGSWPGWVCFVLSAVVTLSVSLPVYSQAESNKARCEKLWNNAFGHMGMKSFPMIIGPDDGGSAEVKYVKKGDYAVFDLIMCRDPSRKDFYIETVVTPQNGDQPYQRDMLGKRLGDEKVVEGEVTIVKAMSDVAMRASYDDKTFGNWVHFKVYTKTNTFPDPTPPLFQILEPKQGKAYNKTDDQLIQISLASEIPDDASLKISWFAGDKVKLPYLLTKATPGISSLKGKMYTSKIAVSTLIKQASPAEDLAQFGFLVQILSHDGKVLYYKYGPQCIIASLGEAQHDDVRLLGLKEYDYSADKIEIKGELPTNLEDIISHDPAGPVNMTITWKYWKEGVIGDLSDAHYATQIKQETQSVPGGKSFTLNLPKQDIFSNAQGEVMKFHVEVTLRKPLSGGNWQRTASTDFIVNNIPYTTGHEFKILSPYADKVYTDTVPIHVSLPKNVSKEKKVSFILMMKTLGQPQEEGSDMDFGYPGGYSILSCNDGELVFDRPASEFLASKEKELPNTGDAAYKLIAVLPGEKMVESYGWFRIGQPGQPGGNAKQKSATLSLDTPLILSPKEHQAFLSPAKVSVELIHAPDKKVVTELQYAPFGKKKTDILLFENFKEASPVSVDENNKTTLGYLLEKPGYYRIRAGNINTVIKWSQWRQFTVDTVDKKLVSSLKIEQAKIAVAPELKLVSGEIKADNATFQKGIQKSQLTQHSTSGKLSKISINPQPEPPGKQMRNLNMPLQVMLDARSYRGPAAVKISVKNAAHSRIPFELRYMPVSARSYQLVSNSHHSFTRIEGQTNLTLSLEKPGHYRIRFRRDTQSPWTAWQSFQVVGDAAGRSGLAGQMQVSPIAARAINPQPEPPGKQTRMLTVPGKSGLKPKIKVQRNQNRQIHLAPPVIKKLANGQKFLLTGKSMHIKAEIAHAAVQKIEVEVQHEKQHHFLPVKKGIRVHRQKEKSTVDILIYATGNYRMRTRDIEKGSHWSRWTTFNVAKVMKNRPHSAMKKSPVQVKKRPISPVKAPKMNMPSVVPQLR